MTTDPLLQRTYDDGFGEAIEELNTLMERLTVEWGGLIIECSPGRPGAGIRCVVSDQDGSRVYRAPTLLDALRKAAADLEAQP